MPAAPRPAGVPTSRVLAATDRGLWDAAVETIGDDTVVDLIKRAVSQPRFLTVEKTFGERVYVAAPLLIPDASNLGARPLRAAVCVVADQQAMRASDRYDGTAVATAVFVVVAATVFAAGLLFESLIVARLRGVVRHFQAPLREAPTLVESGSDEIAAIVRSYGAALADSETIRRTLEETNARLVATMEAVERSNVDLVRARLAAEAANRTRVDFLANMSHELRTPLTAIIGYSDMIGVGIVTKEEAADYARTIRRNGEHLLAMINDVLDLSALEAGRLRMVPTAFDPTEAARRVADRLRAAALAKGLELAVHQEAPLPAITTDRARLEQILGYLVDNAVKFTPTGRIDIHVEPEDRERRRGVRFRVSDTGIGMTPDVMAAAFRSFTQADSTNSRRFGGTGIGLAVARRLAAALGARLSVASEVGRGSTFTLEIPESPTAAPEPAVDGGLGG